MRRIAVLLLAACGSKGSSPPDAGSPPAIDELVAACAVDDACQIGRGGQNVDDCVTYFAEGRGLFSPTQVHCLAMAGASCDHARACVGETITMNPSCSGQSCNGTTVTDCVLGARVDTDCTQLLGAPPGLTCLASGGTAKCSLGMCATGDPDSCDGTIAKRCNAPFVDAADCSAQGLTCSVATGTAECVGDGAACTVDRMDATAIYDCRGSFEHRVDCATAIAGTSPQKDPTSSRAFCGVATDCLPWMASGQCSSATTLSVCEFGAIRDLDCTALGFAGCHLTACM
jgi:hypothetical protein